MAVTCVSAGIVPPWPAGLGLALIIKNGFKAPLEAVFGMLVGRSVRYFLIVIFAGIVWPLTFKWFASLGSKE